MKRKITSFFSCVLVAYFFSAFFIFMPYYNWEYAKYNGFFSWLVFGEVAATAKAFVWPYFVFLEHEGTTNANREETAPESVAHLQKSVLYFNGAQALIKSLPQSKNLRKDLEAIVELIKQSRDEAEKIDRHELNTVKSGLGAAIETHYLVALRLYTSAFSTGGDRNDAYRGDAAMAKFYTYMGSQSGK